MRGTGEYLLERIGPAERRPARALSVGTAGASFADVRRRVRAGMRDGANP